MVKVLSETSTISDSSPQRRHSQRLLLGLGILSRIIQERALDDGIRAGPKDSTVRTLGDGLLQGEAEGGLDEIAEEADLHQNRILQCGGESDGNVDNGHGCRYWEGRER